MRFLLVALFLVTANGAPKAKPVAQPLKRKPAQEGPFTCDVDFVSPNGTRHGSYALSPEAKFPGLDAHEEVTLSVKGMPGQVV